MNADDVFATLESCAAAGKRCPNNKPLGPFEPRFITKLARAGKIRVEVYTLNFRVVTILAGPHRGKRTQEPPLHRDGTQPRPYMVSDVNGVHRNGIAVQFERRTKPAITLRKFSWEKDENA